MPVDPNTWFQSVLALGFFVFAFWTTYTQHSQWLTSERAIKQALFDKRFQIYEDAVQFGARVQRNFKPDIQDFSFSWAIRHRAEFLFKDDVTDTLKRLHDIAADITALKSMIEGVPQSDERIANVQRQHALIIEFNRQLDHLKEAFNPYLDFRALA